MRRVILILFLLVLPISIFSCSPPDVKVFDTPVTWVVPQAMDDKGVVSGKLLNLFDNNPVLGTPFLSRNLSSDDPEMPATISFSMQSDPRAVINEQTGDFYFQDIEPDDDYVIVLHYGPGKIIVVQKDGSEYPLMISVKPDETNDLGTIFVLEP